MRQEYSDGFFSCDREHGFLPIHEPLRTLPQLFTPLQKILNNMTIHQEDGSQGTLAKEGEIVKEVDQLRNFLSEVSNVDDPFEVQALYRAYCFLASAYLLEPSYHHFVKTGEYGQARKILPKNIAQPLCALANKLETHPWMEYSYGYSLGNYTKRDPEGGFNWENLQMAVSFSGTPDENGFIMVHVDINQFSPNLVRSVMDVVESDSQEQTLEALELCYNTMKNMNQRRQEMWKASNYTKYNDFRIFIMGILGNEKVFGPDGVTYHGVWDEPKKYRGQSGSQDTIIPMLDTCFRIIDYYPNNDLTKYLYDMRKYRPQVFQSFLKDLEKESVSLLDRVEQTAGDKGLIYYLAILNEIYRFRNGHWQFVQKYIMSNTAYPVATGGTPIISWIPNQIEATLMSMKNVLDRLNKYESDDLIYLQIKEQYPNKMGLLASQINELKNQKYDVDLIYECNKQYQEVDNPLENANVKKS